MRAPRITRFRRLLAVGALVATGVAVAGAQVTPAAPVVVTIDLCAKAATHGLAGGASVPIWGFARLGAGQSCADVTAGLPGPVLDVGEGDQVTITVHNALDEPVSLEIPGESIAQGEAEAAPGGTAAYTFTASAPGTFLYQSSANAGRQLAMGLYGALVVRPAAGAGTAYGTAGSAFDTERVLVLSAIDPALNADPGGFNLYAWAPTYWMINGRSYPDTPDISAPTGQRLLLRYLNAGFDQTTMALLGTHERVIGRDGFSLVNPLDAVAETIPAGQTMDALVTVEGGRMPLYNRQLHLTNGPGALGDPGFWPGGMMTFIAGS